MKRVIYPVILMVLLTFVFATESKAEEYEGVKFDNAYFDEGRELVLQGIGMKRFLFMKAFVAGLYLEKNEDAMEVLDNVPKHLEVSYFLSIPGHKLSSYTKSIMKRNISKEEYHRLEHELDKMESYFVDLEPGDRFSLTYLPDVGTKFAFNGNIIGVIKGEEFGRGIFSVWLGDQPMDQHIKQKILNEDQTYLN